ncbi:MAG TPA: 50S ribosomal protein L6 [Desulfobacter sp.]|jgi:large subunit ribosomal protein L6|uniref:50S ribosomal protein L6 n=1 Tax=unclassified Desulfobacter TaxID=2634406 RepID=UPI000E7D36D6|nr:MULTISPECIES: 50S ribosomal protein L6 [unclassified Desulfobacter]MBP8828066.1 50S ribosomal protein L6 [Desulfobacter sp.]MBP9597601.1 50S ribosomal protein L6 [Desulfobacter sp.]HAR35055.1 50S ribosomal protein L6 [Desulfobacter sp.]HBT87374.1 50S ribosomal protein L6 [Desulfobacter sp.]
MSRIGKKPVQLPDKVQITLDGDIINVKGPKGSLARKLHPAVNVEIDNQVLNVSTDTSDKKKVALQGLYRSLIYNMVYGVTEGYEKKLVLSGIGYRAETKGKSLVLSVGYSNPVDFALPDGVTAAVDKNVEVTLACIDKELLGQAAANIRAIRPPEPYKGKGIMYADERIIRKAGKTAGKD